MGRIIRITTDAAISVSAARHLLTYKAPANQLVRVLEAGWYAATSEDTKQLETVCGVYTGVATGGSTGITATKADGGDAAHGGTLYKDTPDGDLALGNIIHSDAAPCSSGFQYRPVPEQLLLVPAASQVSLRLCEAPAAATDIRPWLVLELIGA